MNNTLLKGLKVLEVLARSGGPMGVKEVSVVLGMPKSGAFRMLQALADEMYVTRHEGGTYSVSIKLWELGSAALFSFDLRRRAAAVMESLMQTTGETTHLSVLDQREVVYVHKVDGPEPVRAYSQIGGRAAANCVATGKVMMAFRNPQWLSEAKKHLVAATPLSVATPEDFLAEMSRIRRLGYAVNMGGWRKGVNGLAAPIFDGSGAVIAALGISGPEERLGPARLRRLTTPVCEVAQQMSMDIAKASPHASLLSVTNHWGRTV